MRHNPLAISYKELSLLLLLASLIWTGCSSGAAQDLPDRCPVTLNVHYGGSGSGGNVSTQWSPDAENILYRFSSLSYPRGWYLASLSTNSTEPLFADSKWKEDLRWAIWSPTEDVVIFTHGGTSPSFNNMTVYRLDVHSRTVIQLLEGVGGGLTLSPDGQQFIFLKGQNWSDQRWYIMNVDGTDERLLTDKSNFLMEMWHPFEPKFLVLLSGDIENQSDNIGILDVDSGYITQLTDTPACEYQPRWAPDGSQIAFISRDQNYDIYIMDADGTNVINLTNTTPQHEIDFSWSPDGRQIVYTRYHATSAREFSQEIYVMNADGSEQRPLTDTSDEHEFGPVWSPDGKQIAFWSTGQVGEGLGSHWWTLNVMNVDGSNRRVLATFGPTTLESDDSYPSP